MKNRYILTAFVFAAASCMLLPSAQAQKASGGNDASAKGAPTPRLPDGHPDFSGVWYTGVIKDIDHIPPNENHRAYDPKVTPQEKPSFQPWAAQKIKLMGTTTDNHLELLVPNLECLPRGALSYFIGSG